MDWEKEALDSIEEFPLPPVMTPFAKMDAEMRAKKKGLKKVTTEMAKKTAKGYEIKLGKETMEMLRDMASGKEVDLPGEFFEEDAGELYSITLCPAKFGACTREKREMMRQILAAIREKLKALNVTDIMMNKANSPLMSHHTFTVSLVGCPNACLSPYLSDFGVICQYMPEVKDAGCTQCTACVRYCSEGAIVLQDSGPVIDLQKCVRCGGCEKMCREGVIFTSRKTYRVIVGGAGGRHPQIARTVLENTDVAGVLNVLENAVNLFNNTPCGDKEISFHETIIKHGIDELAG